MSSRYTRIGRGFKSIGYLVSLLLSPANIIVDSIHFQYNGMLNGLLVLSVHHIQERPLLSAFLFSALLCSKHIFIYLAPAWFFHLLENYVLENKQIHIARTICLGLVVTLPVAVAFGPFVALGQTTNIVSRLFPFQRGLCHAYWAPNFWAIYSFCDRLAIKCNVALNK